MTNLRAIKSIMLSLALLALMSIACGTGDPHKYPTGVADNFTKSCTKDSGMTKEQCTCVFEKVQKKYTFDEFAAIDKKAETGTVPPDFVKFAEDSRAESAKK